MLTLTTKARLILAVVALATVPSRATRALTTPLGGPLRPIRNAIVGSGRSGEGGHEGHQRAGRPTQKLSLGALSRRSGSGPQRARSLRHLYLIRVAPSMTHQRQASKQGLFLGVCLVALVASVGTINTRVLTTPYVL